MKIVFVLECADLMTNGTTATCVRFAEELIKKGHEVTILGVEYQEGKDYPGRAKYVGLPKYDFPLFQWVFDREGFHTAKVVDATIYEAVKGSDVVHLFLPFKLQSHTRLIAQALGIPVTSAFHLQPQNITSTIHLNRSHLVNSMLFAAFKQYQFNYTRNIHCPSEMIARELRKHNYRRNKFYVISNGVVEYFHRVNTPRPEEYKGKFIITMSGRLSHEKRQDLIIRAIAGSKYNDRIQLILCGQGPEKGKLERIAEKAGLAHPFVNHFCEQEELRNILSWTDLYVHASDFEIEGISCIEAFACGAVPLISDSKYSATPTFSLDDDKSLFKHGNVRDLRKKIEWFIEHPAYIEKIRPSYIEEGKQYALKRMVDKMEQMFLDAIEDKANGRDLPTQYPRMKDVRKQKRIMRALYEEGLIKD